MRTMRKATVPLWAVAVLAVGVVGLAATHAGAAGVRTTDEAYPTAGLVGVVSGEAARLNVSNVATSTCNAKVELLSSQGIIINYRTVSVALAPARLSATHPARRPWSAPRWYRSVGPARR
jgi:hypothetical protein